MAGTTREQAARSGAKFKNGNICPVSGQYDRRVNGKRNGQITLRAGKKFPSYNPGPGRPRPRTLYYVLTDETRHVKKGHRAA